MYSITATQAQNLCALWDLTIAATAQALWSENGGAIIEYEEAFEAACEQFCISETHMNEALLMRSDGAIA
jgi:hypothetical protein